MGVKKEGIIGPSPSLRKGLQTFCRTKVKETNETKRAFFSFNCGVGQQGICKTYGRRLAASPIDNNLVFCINFYAVVSLAKAAACSGERARLAFIV